MFRLLTTKLARYKGVSYEVFSYIDDYYYISLDGRYYSIVPNECVLDIDVVKKEHPEWLI